MVRVAWPPLLLKQLLTPDVGRLPALLMLLVLPMLPPRCIPPPPRPASMGLRRSREGGRRGRWSRRRALQCTAPSSHWGTRLSGPLASCHANPKAGSLTLKRKW